MQSEEFPNIRSSEWMKGLWETSNQYMSLNPISETNNHEIFQIVRSKILYQAWYNSYQPIQQSKTH